MHVHAQARTGANATQRSGADHMSKIIRTEPNEILAKAVEYHGFIYVQGITARDLSLDIRGQTEDVLAQISALLEAHGTDNSRLLQAQIWLKDIGDRDALNRVWSAWLPTGQAPARACVQANLADPRQLVEIMVTSTK
jgi:enamine deaminase RidA (YjgF/YER057c/UK114 family)